MIPLLLVELIWKAIYLLAFAPPLWLAHQVTPSAASDIQATLVVVIFIPPHPLRLCRKAIYSAHGGSLEAWLNRSTRDKDSTAKLFGLCTSKCAVAGSAARLESHRSVACGLNVLKLDCGRSYFIDSVGAAVISSSTALTFPDPLQGVRGKRVAGLCRFSFQLPGDPRGVCTALSLTPWPFSLPVVCS